MKKWGDQLLWIDGFDTTRNFRILHLKKSVFHDALEFVMKGEHRFHVQNDNRQLFDLVYIENQTWVEGQKGYSKAALFQDFDMYPPCFNYDEDNKDSLCLDVFEAYSAVWFEEVNEYSVTLARILLRDTEKQVSFGDERILWFMPEEKRLTIAARPAEPGVMCVTKNFYPSAFLNDFSRMDTPAVFNNVFFFQWLTSVSPRDIHYLELVIPQSEGIGCILTTWACASDWLAAKGIKVTLRRGTARYGDSLLERYLQNPFTPEDADKQTVVTLYSFMYFTFLYPIRTRKTNLQSYISQHFLSEVKEYSKAILDGRKTLGVLLRGSDYVTSGMSFGVTEASIDVIIAMIRAAMAEGHYVRLFLATEDQDILDRMRIAFPGQLLAVAQERYKVSSLQDAKTISEYERKTYSDKDYERHLDDTTANYLYAMWLISRCDAFVYSCRCRGTALAEQLCDNGFKKTVCIVEELLRRRTAAQNSAQLPEQAKQ